MRPLYLVSYSLAFATSFLRSHGVLRLQLQLVGQSAQLRAGCGFDLSHHIAAVDLNRGFGDAYFTGDLLD
jgi:hypothetical protein